MSLGHQQIFLHHCLHDISLIKEDQRTPLVQHFNKIVIGAKNNSYVDTNQLQQFNEHKVFLNLFPKIVQREYQQQKKICLNEDDVNVLCQTYNVLKEKMDNLNDHDDDDVCDDNRCRKTGTRNTLNQTKIDRDFHKQQCTEYVSSIVEPSTNKNGVDEEELLYTTDDINYNPHFTANNIQVQQKQDNDAQIDNASDSNPNIEEEADNDLGIIGQYQYQQRITAVEFNLNEKTPKRVSPFQIQSHNIGCLDEIRKENATDKKMQSDDKCPTQHNNEAEVYRLDPKDANEFEIGRVLSIKASKPQEKIHSDNAGNEKGIIIENIALKHKSKLSANADIFSAGINITVLKPQHGHNCKLQTIDEYNEEQKAIKRILEYGYDFIKENIGLQIEKDAFIDYMIGDEVISIKELVDTNNKKEFCNSLLREYGNGPWHSLFDCIFDRLQCLRLQQTVDDLQQALSYQQKTVDVLKQSTSDQRKVIGSNKQYINSLESINNHYLLQCLDLYLLPIVPHPTHQYCQSYPPFIATYVDPSQNAVTGYMSQPMTPMNASCYIGCNVDAQTTQTQYQCLPTKSNNMYQNNTLSNVNRGAMIRETHGDATDHEKHEQHIAIAVQSNTKKKTCRSRRKKRNKQQSRPYADKNDVNNDKSKKNVVIIESNGLQQDQLLETKRNMLHNNVLSDINRDNRNNDKAANRHSVSDGKSIHFIRKSIKSSHVQQQRHSRKVKNDDNVAQQNQNRNSGNMDRKVKPMTMHIIAKGEEHGGKNRKYAHPLNDDYGDIQDDNIDPKPNKVLLDKDDVEEQNQRKCGVIERNHGNTKTDHSDHKTKRNMMHRNNRNNVQQQRHSKKVRQNQNRNSGNMDGRRSSSHRKIKLMTMHKGEEHSRKNRKYGHRLNDDYDDIHDNIDPKPNKVLLDKDDVEEQNQRRKCGVIERNHGNTKTDNSDHKTNDDKVLLVLRGLPGCGKMEWVQKIQKRNENTVVFNDCRMEQCARFKETHLNFARFKELVIHGKCKCIILVNDDPRIGSYERFIKYAVDNGYIFGRIIEFYHNERLIKRYQSRTDPDLSFLLKIWERDPRAELIYSCEEEKKYDTEQQ